MELTWTRLPDHEPGNRYYSVPGLHQETQVVVMHEDAITDRMAFYGLKDENEALRHIFFEHFIRMSPHREAEVPVDVLDNLKNPIGLQQARTRTSAKQSASST